jgi:hypothetical protein
MPLTASLPCILGSTEAVYFIESIMEHVAVSLGKTAIEVKKLNFYSDGDTTVDGSKLSDVRSLQVTEQLLRSAGVADRQESIGKFNRLAVVPLRYAATWMGFSFNCLVSIYHNGGMVAVTHGGIEMGQGINTKVRLSEKGNRPFPLIFIRPVGGASGGSSTGHRHEIRQDPTDPGYYKRQRLRHRGQYDQ